MEELPMGMLSMYGYRVFEVPRETLEVDIYKQIIFPKRKNRRIQARYKNNPKYWGYVKERRALVTKNDIFMDSDMIDAMKYSTLIKNVDTV